ncbi:uncharacterized protein LOC115627781 [Scaptodrosophila lebanonensis]|uniref:Uncharacterized protein LOC115627781 n=1 Tax=Drosophila lebanonensis TaxID=7225 RepID=A0A6J2TV38_DROLE|nr:uncharacterized protein LOC115627781 [Scaptodrosophila lebanonensis]
MKIRNEQSFAAILQDVLDPHGTRIDVGEAIGKAVPHNYDGLHNLGELQQNLRQCDYYSTWSSRLIDNSKLIRIIWDFCFPSSRPRPQYRQIQTEENQAVDRVTRRYRQRNSLITYPLHKLAQLCLVIVLLLPFLITSTTLVQQASGQSISNPMSNVNSNANPIANTTQQPQLSHQQQHHRTPKSTQIQTGYGYAFAYSLNAQSPNHIPLSDTNTNTSNNNTNISIQFINKNYSINNKTKSNTTTNIYTNTNYESESRKPISNLRSNEYSLIILSQAANRISLPNTTPNSTVTKTESSNTSTNTSTHTDDDDVLHHFVNGIGGLNSQYLSGNAIRSKRDIYSHRRRQEQVDPNANADSQMMVEAFESFKTNKNRQRPNRSIDKEKLTKLVMSGLGLKKLPDMRKANISQVEYTSKYLEYLQRLQSIEERRGKWPDHLTVPATGTLHIFSIASNSFSDITDKRWRHKRAARAMATNKQNQTKKKKNTNLNSNNNDARDKTNILLHFPLGVNDAHFHSDSIDEANVRLMLLFSSSLSTQRWGTKKKMHNQRYGNGSGRKKNCGVGVDEATLSTQQLFERGLDRRKKARIHILNLKVYQLLSSNKRELLDARKLEFENPGEADETRTQWLEFDVTKAVRRWLSKSHQNLGIEIQCDKCRRVGARILSDVSASSDNIDEDDDRFHLRPVLNIIGHLGHTHREGGVHHPNTSGNQTSNYYHHRSDHNRLKPNNCYKAHQRCCRHQLDVAFKDIAGFEFIIQPKMFDAGYCQGRCPPRHNPAHHHALLQSLIWQKDHSRVPRPCCAPSKLVELEVLHLDEEHSDQLKISTWSDMQVVECACS